MRNVIISSIIALIFHSVSYGQSYSRDIEQRYKVWIIINKTPYKQKGFLYQLNDSSILLTKSFSPKDKTVKKQNLYEIMISNIELIKIRRKGRVSRGISIGVITGFAIGALVTKSLFGDDSRPTENYVYLGLPITAIGLGIGIASGLHKTKIRIDGNIDSFNKNRENLQKITAKQ